jgi:hypothetical protein
MLHNLISHLQRLAVTCTGDNAFFGFPTWYKYIPGQCNTQGITMPPNVSIFDVIPLIGLAILEIALRLAGILAIFFVIYGGIIYTTSQGEPDKVGQAKGTIINALAGLVICVLAVAVVSFVGARVG